VREGHATGNDEDLEGRGTGRPERAGKSGRTGPSERSNKSEKKNGPLAVTEIRLGRPGLRFPDAPDRTVEIKRNKKREGAETRLIKIDADPREDLLVTRVSVGLWQIARVLVTKKITVQISFESMLQRPDGSFA